MYKTIFFLVLTIFIFFSSDITTYANDDATARLEIAIINDDYPMAQKAFKDGANLNDARFHDGNNPLSLAINRNSIAMVNLLLQKGANVNSYSSSGHYLDTPLLQAIKQQNLPIVTLLLNAKADVNMPSILSPQPSYTGSRATAKHNGISPLMASVMAKPQSAYASSKYAIFELLLAKGADINYATSEGFSILMATTIGENSLYQQQIALTMAKTLLKKGVDPTFRDNTGKTALDYAKIAQFTKMIELLTSVTEK